MITTLISLYETHSNGSFTLAGSDPDTDSMKFYCQWLSVSLDTSKQFYTSHVFLGLGLGVGQCKHTIRPEAFIKLEEKGMSQGDNPPPPPPQI